jgi:Domain of unknown function (DUF4082)
VSVSEAMEAPAATAGLDYEVVIPDMQINRSANFTMGVKFKVTEACDATGILFQVDPNEALFTGWRIALYRKSDQALLASSYPATVTGGVNRVPFTAPVPLLPDVVYLSVSYNPPGSYGFLHSAAYVGPMVSGPLRILQNNEDGASTGMYASGDVYPATEWASTLCGSPTPLVTVPGPAAPPTGGLAAVMQEIAAALATITAEIPDLQIYPYLNSNPTPPSLDIYPGAPFQTGAGFGVGQSQVWFAIRARVSTADQEAGMKLLLRMMDPTDPASVEAAIADSATVTPEGVSEFREYQEDSSTSGRLLGCEWRVSTFL